MDCDAADDELFDRLGEALGVPSIQAYGHYMAMVGQLAKWRTDGRLDLVLDRTLERWAHWETPAGFSGVPATFPRVIRELCQDPATGELRGFRKRNEKLLEKQARDAQKRSSGGKSAGTPQKPARVPAENPRANGNDNDIKERVIPPDLERRVKRQVIGPDEQAVIDHYRRVHPKRLKGAIPDKVLRLLRVALKGYSAEALCLAIDGNAASPFHREHGHLGLDLILRDASKIDYFLDLAGRAATRGVEMTDEFGEMRLHTQREGWWGYEKDGQWVRTLPVERVSA